MTKEHQKNIESPFNSLVEECVSSRSFLHCVNILNTGEEALLARIHLIRCAQTSIDIQTYIWKDDSTGQLFIYELMKAAQRGVKVRLLIDPWASVKDPGWVAGVATAHPNLELKYYNPSSKEIHPTVLDLLHDMVFHFKQVNQRMHNKTFIIDGRIGIVGGRNYQNDYYDRGTTRNFKDRDVLVVGPIVRDMSQSFKNYWNYQLSIYAKDLVDVWQTIANKDYQPFYKLEDASIKPPFQEMSQRASDDEHIRKAFIETTHRVSNIQFISDQPGKNQSSTLDGGGVVFDEFIRFMQNAKNEIVAQTPYLVLGKKSFVRIKEMRKSNPDLDIFISTNSLASTDNIYTYSYACKLRKRYIKNLRFRVFEFKPQPGDYDQMIDFRGTGEHRANLCIHAKTFIADETSVWIGSLNVDPRSYNLNTEVAVIIHDPQVAKSVKDNIRVDLAPQNSWVVGRRASVPLVSRASGILSTLIKYTSFIKIWPFRYTEDFELKKGKDPVPFYDERFYDHYVSAGPYPGMNSTLREVEVMLLKAFIEIARPLL